MSANKYNSRKVETKDGKFDSKAEFERWKQLKQMQKDGEIHQLKRQVKFELIPAQKINGKTIERACSYIADFTYYYKGSFVVEDVKGHKTPVYNIKKKLMLERHGIRIQEVNNGRAKNVHKKNHR